MFATLKNTNIFLFLATWALQFYLKTCTVHFNDCPHSLSFALLASPIGILDVWQQLYLLMLYIFIPFYIHTQTLSL